MSIKIPLMLDFQADFFQGVVDTVPLYNIYLKIREKKNAVTKSTTSSLVNFMAPRKGFILQ
jgi:hypothetical protein